jgi:hypothetical protein
MQCSAVQCSALQFRNGLFDVVQYDKIKHNTMQ